MLQGGKVPQPSPPGPKAASSAPRNHGLCVWGGLEARTEDIWVQVLAHPETLGSEGVELNGA